MLNAIPDPIASISGQLDILRTHSVECRMLDVAWEETCAGPGTASTRTSLGFTPELAGWMRLSLLGGRGRVLAVLVALPLSNLSFLAC